MSKPEDIPADVWRIAEAYALSGLAPVAFDTIEQNDAAWFAVTNAIAYAIMAERYRCARIAAPLPMEPDDSGIEKQAYDIRAGIEGAILKRAG